MFDLSLVETIKNLTIYGLTLVALTSFVKTALQKLFKSTANWIGYLSSALSSVGFTIYYLASQHIFTIQAAVLYSALVFLTSNVIFKAVHTPSN